MGKTTVTPSAAKGRFLEYVVQRLQEPWVKEVKTRVRLAHNREIDVLATISGPLGDLYVAFECKNWSKPVQVKDIGEFRDKLDQVGLPVSQAIYVTTSTFTRGARSRATQLGMQTLLARGLTKDGLRVAINRSILSHVIVFPIADMLQPLSNMTGPGQHFEKRLTDPPVSFDEPLNAADQVDDIEGVLNRLADLWCEGRIPRRLGRHSGLIRLPDGYRFGGLDQSLLSGAVWVNMQVSAAVFQLDGVAAESALVDVASGTPRQQFYEYQFPQFEGGRSELLFDSEEALAGFLTQQAVGLQLVHRTHVPRVQFKAFWWPLSAAAVERAHHLWQQGEVLTFENVENSSVARGYFEDPRRTEDTSPETEEQT